MKDRIINKLKMNIKNKLQIEIKLSLKTGISNLLLGQPAKYLNRTPPTSNKSHHKIFNIYI